MDKLLNELVDRLRQAGGENLRSVVLYGSATSSDYHPQHSDLNVLAVFGNLDAGVLDRVAPVAQWWQKKGHPGPMVFTEEELRRSSDMFAIELLDIKATGRLLWGEEIFAGLEVPMQWHRIQVERQLAQSLVRLRQHYLAGGGSNRATRQLLLTSISTFTALFRHGLLAMGEPIARDRRQVIDRLSALIGVNPAPFHVLLDLREGENIAREIDWKETFAAYLAAIERVAEEVNRRLAATVKPAQS